MAKKIGNVLKKFFGKRTNILLLIFAAMSAVLFARIFDLQIIRGQSFAEDFDTVTTRTRTLRSARGNIYDAAGRLLAWNDLSNAVILEDNGTYETMREKNLALNGEILRLADLIRSKGDQLLHDFHIVLDASGNYAFDIEEGISLSRFRADIFGYPYVEDMSREEAEATPEEIIDFLSGEEKFGITCESEPYTPDELALAGLPDRLTKEQTLTILVFRYQLSLISYQRYIPVTVATGVSDATVAAIEELSDAFQGVSISEDYTRRYVHSDAMGPILGYTGLPSAEELEKLREIDPQYSNTSVIGKSGLEQTMESSLQGTDGQETVTVNNVGKVLAIDEASRVAPAQGKDLTLSIDLELQEVIYKILEQRIAGILITNIELTKESEVHEDNDMVTVPIYSIYYALINNNLIDLEHLDAADAGENERRVQQLIADRYEQVSAWIAGDLAADSALIYNRLDEEHQVYIDYISYDFLEQKEGIINANLVDTTDAMYQNFHQKGTVSLKDYLLYAINRNWISLGKLDQNSDYLDSEQIFDAILQYVQEKLPEDLVFMKKMCRYMLLDDTIAPRDLCMILYEQGFLDTNDAHYADFLSGKLRPEELMIEKISNLEITPAQLALDPCSGSAVVTDPETGKVKACVSYPGYDSNHFVNNFDDAYYQKLLADNSTPFYNKATQQLTAPGSTFKPVIAAAGYAEGLIDHDTEIFCSGLFGEGLVGEGDQLHCYNLYGHGNQSVVQAISNSCNVFFCTIGYELGQKDTGRYRDRTAVRYIQEYSHLFGFDLPSGIEMPESDPHVSSNLPIPSSIGQGEHQYTTVQLAKYAGTLATGGKGYRLTLIDREQAADGSAAVRHEPELLNQADFNPLVWEDIHDGMRHAVTDSIFFNASNMPIDLYAKTGTAQEDLTRPSHSVFVGFTKGQDSNIAIAVRIPHGYSSANATLVARDITQYYYQLRTEEDILTGTADNSEMSRAIRND